MSHEYSKAADHVEKPPPKNAGHLYESLKGKDFAADRPPDVQIELPVPIDRDKPSLPIAEYHATDPVVRSSSTSLEGNDERDEYFSSCDFIDVVDELICCHT